jgi:DNA-directed RNA polymerase specialized sigma24 family protein
MEAAAVALVRSEPRAQTRTGDREAFVRLYEPDFDGLVDLLLRTLRDSGLASAALHDALDRARNEFQTQGAPFDVRCWLYGVAREAAIARPARRRTNSEEREGLDYTRVDANRLSDSTTAFDRELIQLVWDEVRTYDRDDYTLLDLHVRRDLSVHEIAEQLGLSHEAVAGRLSWLCGLLNEEVASLLLARRARHGCAGLDAELRARPGDEGRAVRHHVRECEACRETKRRFVSATEVLGSFSLMPAPPSLRKRTAQAFLAPVKGRVRAVR